MKPTPYQLKTLQAYLDLRSDNGSVLGQMRRNTWVFIYQLVRLVIGVPIAFLIDARFGILVLGLILGTVIRDIQFFIQRKRIWPVIAEVLDWQRIDDLLNS